MSSDYIISFTDPANGSFVLKPSSTNGPLSPIATTPLDPQATSADTSIVLLGKGMYMYGERFQKSVVHMLEHFSYKSRPAYAIQGQIWYKNQDFDDTVSWPTDPIIKGLYVFDGLDWQEIVVNGSITGDLDMGGNKIINLGSPTAGTDATTKNYVDTADALKVAKAGDTMSGELTIDLTASPSLSEGLYIKAQSAASVRLQSTVAGQTAPGIILDNPDSTSTFQYTIWAARDNKALSVEGRTTNTTNLAAGTSLFVVYPDGSIEAPLNNVTIPTHLTTKSYVDASTALKVNKAGDTMTGFLVLNADPTLAMHAATKQYVDAAISGAAGVTSYNGRSGVVTGISADVTNALGYTPVNRAGDTMAGFLVLNADPTTAMQASTKQYTDNAAIAAASGKVNVSGDTMTGYLSLISDPINPLHAATKQYVDNAVVGLDVKQSVRLATTSNIALDNTTTSVDGVLVADGNRILVKDQTLAEENGIYVASTSTGWSRSLDADGGTGTLNSGTFTFVEEGTVNNSTGWVLQTPDPIVVDTTPLTFIKFSSTALGYTPVNKAGDTITGTIYFQAPVVEKSPAAVNPVSNVLTLDCSTGTVIKATLNANVTSVAITNVPNAVSNSAFSITVLLSQDGVGGRTVAWTGPTIRWAGGVAPTMTTTTNKMDVISLLTVDGGTTWLGNFSQNY